MDFHSYPYETTHGNRLQDGFVALPMSPPVDSPKNYPGGTRPVSPLEGPIAGSTVWRAPSVRPQADRVTAMPTYTSLVTPVPQSSTDSITKDLDDNYPFQTHKTDITYAENVLHAETKKPSRRPSISWWWWWEIGAALLSAISMCLVLAVLINVNNRPLAAWALPIQPNSLISVFTTIGKTSMLVPVAAALSQLKWRHFFDRPQRLDHLQLFDDASRGPWGSFMMLCSVRTRAVLAWGFAIVTVVALGIEPTAQQILDFPSREVDVDDMKVEIAMALNYSSKTFATWGMFLDGDADGTARLVGLEYAIGNGALGVAQPPHFECPEAATTCSYDSFTTLALCSEFRNRTRELVHNCTTNTNMETNCTFDWPTRALETNPFNVEFFKDALPDGTQRSYDVYRQQFEQRPGVPPSGLVMLAFRTRGGYYGDVNASISAAEFHESRWFWCTQTYNGTTATTASLSPGTVVVEELVDGPPVINDGRKFIAKSTGKQYHIAHETELYIWSYLKKRLTANVNFNAGYDVGALSPDEEALHSLSIGDSNNLAYLLYSANPAEIAESIARTVTSFVRSAPDGDNRNATVLKGRAQVRETFILVRWEWLILPLLETILASLLLVVTIIITSQSGPPLLKTSTLGLLFHGIDGWGPESTKEQLKGKETAEKLEDIARGMRVQFGPDEYQRLRFVQTG